MDARAATASLGLLSLPLPLSLPSAPLVAGGIAAALLLRRI
jgi:hypothetical protein